MYKVVGECEAIATGDRLDLVVDIGVPGQNGSGQKAVSTAVDYFGEAAVREMESASGEFRWKDDDNGCKHPISLFGTARNVVLEIWNPGIVGAHALLMRKEAICLIRTSRTKGERENLL